MKNIIYTLIILPFIFSCGDNSQTKPKKDFIKDNAECPIYGEPCLEKEVVQKRLYDNGRKYREVSWDEESNCFIERWWHGDEANLLKSETFYKYCRGNGNQIDLAVNSGKNREWYINGQLQLDQNFKDGDKDGVCKSYHENGQLGTKDTYKIVTQGTEKKEKYGVLFGTSEKWDEDGLLISRASYNEGKLIGLQIEWRVQNLKISRRISEIMREPDPDHPEYGQIKYEKTWHICDYWDTSTDEFGQLATEVHYNGADREWARNGQLIKDCTNKKIDIGGASAPMGPYKEWYDNGQLKVDGNYLEPYSRGISWKKDGVWKEWWENGIMKVDAKYDEGNILYLKRWSQNGVLIEEM